jgi:glutathione S-transferase
MILIGRLISPTTRRVAVVLEAFGMPYEVRQISVADQDALREFNPLGRVPALQLDDGEILIESTAIADHLAEMAGESQAVLPLRGPARRAVLKANALITGALEKFVAAHYERSFKPEDKVHEPWIERCQGQALSALDHLERAPRGAWLCEQGPSIADITIATAFDFFDSAAAGFIDPARFSGLVRIAQAVREGSPYQAVLAKA